MGKRHYIFQGLETRWGHASTFSKGWKVFFQPLEDLFRYANENAVVADSARHFVFVFHEASVKFEKSPFRTNS